MQRIQAVESRGVGQADIDPEPVATQSVRALFAIPVLAVMQKLETAMSERRKRHERERCECLPHASKGSLAIEGCHTTSAAVFENEADNHCLSCCGKLRLHLWQNCRCQECSTTTMPLRD